MKKILLSLTLLLCCCMALRANTITILNNTGCNFDMTFGINNPLGLSTTVTIPPGPTTYTSPAAVPASWTPALTPAQLASAAFMYLNAIPAGTTTSFLLRAGGGYNSAAAGVFPACAPTGFAATWNVNTSNNIVVLLF